MFLFSDNLRCFVNCRFNMKEKILGKCTWVGSSRKRLWPHAQPILFSILSLAQYWVRSKNHLAPRYAVSSNPVTSSPINTMFSNTLSFLSSRNVSDQVLHPYKTTGKIIVLYILTCVFLQHMYTSSQ